MTKTTKKLAFEDAFERLDEIVRKLESGQLALEENIELFEEGVKLTGECRKQLDQAEAKIQKLVKAANGEFKLEPLD